MDFKNKIVLITGASRGIGRATAIEFARRNAIVVINYQKNRIAAEEVLKELKGENHMIYQADISIPKDIENMIDTIVKKYNRLDILVNNAGIAKFHEIDKVSFEEWSKAWKQILEINLTGVANLCYFAAQRMIQQGGGRIVNVSSRGAFRGEPLEPAYGASKAGLNSLSQSLAKALGQYNIFVGVVAPGYVNTDMGIETLTDKEKELLLKESPLKRIAEPEEVAYAILFLASEGAGYATGSILDFNGASYLRT